MKLTKLSRYNNKENILNKKYSKNIFYHSNLEYNKE